jgi:hypothetical protein
MRNGWSAESTRYGVSALAARGNAGAEADSVVGPAGPAAVLDPEPEGVPDADDGVVAEAVADGADEVRVHAGSCRPGSPAHAEVNAPSTSATASHLFGGEATSSRVSARGVVRPWFRRTPVEPVAVTAIWAVARRGARDTYP